MIITLGGLPRLRIVSVSETPHFVQFFAQKAQSVFYVFTFLPRTEAVC
jgi:hypothetical protein